MQATLTAEDILTVALSCRQGTWRDRNIAEDRRLAKPAILPSIDADARAVTWFRDPLVRTYRRIN
ncbi:hypothetical protein SsS58_08720 [Streptomyces scabiei]|uniref:Uncharacterized protein n=1 Tax=Streptomyces scabiei TaxID=1930 RepID=A0A100JZ04_STRSC|nr:hypothetical protein SsS58_08720 [Streptomyces scabiei]